eukprot:3411854-Pleurochrysis_carterae.AAC.1
MTLIVVRRSPMDSFETATETAVLGLRLKVVKFYVRGCPLRRFFVGVNACYCVCFLLYTPSLCKSLNYVKRAFSRIPFAHASLVARTILAHTAEPKCSDAATVVRLSLIQPHPTSATLEPPPRPLVVARSSGRWWSAFGPRLPLESACSRSGSTTPTGSCCGRCARSERARSVRSCSWKRGRESECAAARERA